MIKQKLALTWHSCASSSFFNFPLSGSTSLKISDVSPMLKMNLEKSKLRKFHKPDLIKSFCILYVVFFYKNSRKN